MIHRGSILEQGYTVNVKGRLTECVFSVPVISSRLTGYEVKGLDGVVEIAEIKLSITAVS
jgi:hypothetical protein